MDIVKVCVFSVVEKKKKAVQRCEEQLLRMEVHATDREENKQIALSTSKLNYLDPRISVAWWGINSWHKPPASNSILFYNPVIRFFQILFWDPSKNSYRNFTLLS